MENKSDFIILSVVAIVAIVALSILFTGSKNAVIFSSNQIGYGGGPGEPV